MDYCCDGTSQALAGFIRFPGQEAPRQWIWVLDERLVQCWGDLLNGQL
jgi:hypothetical protein